MSDVILYTGKKVATSYTDSSCRVYAFASGGTILSIDAGGLSVSIHLPAFGAHELAAELTAAADAGAMQECVL